MPAVAVDLEPFRGLSTRLERSACIRRRTLSSDHQRNFAEHDVAPYLAQMNAMKREFLRFGGHT
jgi:hypothetical protein